MKLLLLTLPSRKTRLSRNPSLASSRLGVLVRGLGRGVVEGLVGGTGLGPAHPDLITFLEGGRGWAIPKSAAVDCELASRQKSPVGPKELTVCFHLGRRAAQAWVQVPTLPGPPVQPRASDLSSLSSVPNCEMETTVMPNSWRCLEE